MGCCCSTPDEDRSVTSEVNERTHLIVPHVDEVTPVPVIVGSLPSTHAPINNEQSALLEILNQAAIEVIDVATADGGLSMEQQDQRSRAKQYSHRLQHMAPNLHHLLKNQSTLSTPGVLVPLPVLQAPTLSAAEIAQITTSADRLSHAVRSMKVVGKGQIVIALNTQHV